MSYVQTVLADKPAGFWMITAPSGTSETDLSGNGKTATINEATDLIDRVYRPLVTGTDTDRAFRMYSSNHQVTYPAMEAWEGSRDHIPFSVEMTFQPIDCTSTREAILFAPQAASSAYVMDNGLYCINNTLRFVVSNGSDTTPATSKAVVQKYLEPGRTYHVVAVYDVSKIKLYVDNVLVDTAEVPSGTGWSHTTANFVTMSNRPTAVTTEVCNFVFDAVSFYRQALSPESINNHYFMSTPNISDVDLVNSLGGHIIKINDEDRVKSFNWSGAEQGWNSDSIELTDCIINDDGSVGLKRIPPVELRTTPSYYGNLLSWNQSSAEIDNSSFFQSTGTPTITRSTAQAAHGVASILLTSTTTATMLASTAVGTSAIPIKPNTQYTFYAEVLLGTVPTGTGAGKIAYRWVDASGATIGVAVDVALTSTAATWTALSGTATSPSNAAYAILYFGSNTPSAASQTVYFDKLGIWEGSSTTWTPPNPYRLPSGIDASDYPKNLVPTPVSLVEGGINGWASGTNCTATYDATRMNDLGGSVKMTAGAAGYMQTYNGAVFGIVPGQKYTAVSHTLAETAPALARTDIYWYTQSGSGAGSTIGGTTTNSTTAWTKTSVTGIAPWNAVSARVGVQINSGGAGHIHYMDGAGLFAGGNTTMYEGAYNTDEINLRDSMFVKVRDAGKHVGKNQGGFGFFADVTATQNDHIQEQCLAAISNTAGDSVIEVVKKTDKNIYLRYKYLNTAGDLTTIEDSWGAISTLLATNAYFFVEWGNGLLRLYVNTTATPAEIAFDNGVKAPRFDENSYLHLGAGADELRPWNNYFKWLKLYNTLQDSADFTYNKTSVNGFTAKLASSLNVSQSGSLVAGILTGSDGTDSIEQTRITWSPRNSNIQVKTSNSGTENILTHDNSTIDVATTGWGATLCTLSKSYAWSAQGASSLLMTETGSTFYQASLTVDLSRMENKFVTVHCVVRSPNPNKVRMNLNGTGGLMTGSTITVPANTDTTYTHTFDLTGRADINSVRVVVPDDPANSNLLYVDKVGVWEGTSTEWSEPLQAAVYGSEIVPGQFPASLPVVYYSMVDLSTDDSYNSPTKLSDLKLEAFSDDTQYAENAGDTFISSSQQRLYSESIFPIRQSLFSGSFSSNTSNAGAILPVDDTANTSVPSGGSGVTTAGPTPNIRTVEFWIYPEAEGGYVWHDGATQYSLAYSTAGGFTTTGFTTLYVDGVSTANGVTLASWYGRWHHIVLTNASAQIDLRSSDSLTRNLLTPNQASVELTASGFTNYTNATIARSLAQAANGTASLSMTAIAAADMAAGTASSTESLVPVRPGIEHTVYVETRAATIARPARVAIFEYDAYRNFMRSNGNVQANNSTSAWTPATYTLTLSPSTCFMTVYAIIVGPALGEVHYADKFGMWEGSSTTWAAPSPRLWFGRAPGGVLQGTARFQNISYYPQTFTAQQALSNYKSYLGDITAGSFSDAPGSRTLTDERPKYYSNLWNSQTISV